MKRKYSSLSAIMDGYDWLMFANRYHDMSTYKTSGLELSMYNKDMDSLEYITIDNISKDTTKEEFLRFLKFFAGSRLPNLDLMLLEDIINTNMSVATMVISAIEVWKYRKETFIPYVEHKKADITTMIKICESYPELLDNPKINIDTKNYIKSML